MKKKKLESVKVSKKFLQELLTPFVIIGKISDFVVEGGTDNVYIYYTMEGGVNNTA